MASSSASSSKVPSPPLDKDLHVAYIQNLDKVPSTSTSSPTPLLVLLSTADDLYQRKDLAYHLTEHLRLNGVYWGYIALSIMGRPEALDREEMIEYVLSCWDDDAGTFGAHPGHDGHILGTLSGIQLLVMQNALDRADIDRITSFLLSLVSPDGQVSGDKFGESDTRFSYIFLSALSLLGRLDHLDRLYDGRGRQLVADNILGSMNFDGAFGLEPGAESHGGQVWVSVAALAILDRLDAVDKDLLGSWLSERQLPNGGLNGRPEKLEDVCYSWWNCAALSIIGRLHWINRDKLMEFILGAQDLEGGGIADRRDDWVDVFHTCFGLAGLSLLGYPELEDIDPVYCMPSATIKSLGLHKPSIALPRLTSYPPS